MGKISPSVFQKHRARERRRNFIFPIHDTTGGCVLSGRMISEAIPVAHLPELFGLHPLTVSKMVTIGVFGPVTIPPGYSRRYRTVLRREVEKRFGALTDERIADAAARHAERMRAKSAAARKRRLCGAQ
jgi:hypothetical protein